MALLAAAMVGGLGVLLAVLGNPRNSGICVSCFLENIAGALGLHGDTRMMYLRPEVPGFLLGASIMALATGGFRARGGSSPMVRFFIGFFIMVGCAMFIGNFGFSSLLMTEPGSRAGVVQIAGDPKLGQMPFFVCTCDYTIIGEEYFAAGSYVSADPAMRGGLVSQDLIKVIFAALIVVGLGGKLLLDSRVLPGALGTWMEGFVKVLTHYSD